MIKHVETVLDVKLTSAVALAMTAMIVKHPNERVQLSQRQKKVDTNLCSCCVRTDRDSLS